MVNREVVVTLHICIGVGAMLVAAVSINTGHTVWAFIDGVLVGVNLTRALTLSR